MSTASPLRVAIIGAGAWGTALAIAASRDRTSLARAQDREDALEVSLWCRQAPHVASMREQRENQRYLPGFALPPSLNLGCVGHDASLADVARSADLVVLATPMSALRHHLQALSNGDTPVAWLCKGFEAQPEGIGLLGHEIHAQVAPVNLPCGVLSGPSFAQEVARQQPTALVAASSDAPLRQMLVDAFHSQSLRVYASDDVVGVEVGGAVKNVLAIATGLCDGLSLGLNARAALITRGLAEMTRLGVALGARLETFMGLTGLGDLVLTATGDLSRNRKVGLLLAEGQLLEQAVASLGHVAEGVYSARTVLRRAQSLGVDMPITEAVVALLDGASTPAEVIRTLMGRDPRSEL